MNIRKCAITWLAQVLITAMPIVAVTLVAGCNAPNNVAAPIPIAMTVATSVNASPTVRAGGGSAPGPSATGAAVSTTAAAKGVGGGIVRGAGLITVTLPMEQPFSIKLGDKLVVLPPIAGLNVIFDAAMLQLATGKDTIQPPPEGWVWTARAKGKTQIEFYSNALSCDDKTQQCPNMPSFQTILLIEIVE